MPATAATFVAPDSVADPGFAPKAIVTLPVKLVTTLPNASSAATTTGNAVPAEAVPGGGVW